MKIRNQIRNEEKIGINNDRDGGGGNVQLI